VSRPPKSDRSASCPLVTATRPRHLSPVIVYTLLDDRSSLDHPLGDAIETFIRREDAERFIED
jgi:hypothetical protein